MTSTDFKCSLISCSLSISFQFTRWKNTNFNYNCCLFCFVKAIQNGKIKFTVFFLLSHLTSFFFTGVNLAFGAGEVTKLKWSMDLKQRFTSVIHYLFVKTRLKKVRTICGIRFWLFFPGFQCQQRQCRDKNKNRASNRWGESQDQK